MSSYEEAREAAARAVERARKESAAAHFGHGTEDPEVWKLCRRQDGGEVELFVGPMDKMIEAMDASIAKDISNAAIDAFLAKLSETHAVVRVPTEAQGAALLAAFRSVFTDDYGERNLHEGFAIDLFRAMLSAQEVKP